MLKKLQKRYKEIMARLTEIRKLEGDALTDEVRKERDDLLEEVRTVKADIDAQVEIEELETRSLDTDPNNPDPDNPDIEIEDQPIYRGTPVSALGQQAVDVAIVTARDAGKEIIKEAQSRLEQNTKRALTLIEKRQGQKPSKEFRERSEKPLYDPESRAAGTGMIQGIGSEGGFLLQSETSIDLMTHGFNNSEVLRRCQRRTLTGSESLEILGIDETSRADGSRGGGVRVYTDAELSQITSSRTKFEKIKLSPERLTGLYYASDKILMNATFLGQEMSQLFREEFAFKTQDLVMEGTGAGQAVGLKNADCIVSISAESGQSGTILSENVLKMFMRFYLRAGIGAVCWLANRDTFFNLYTLTYDIGTGGEMARLYIPPRNPGETGSMLGYPVVFIEQCETLGTAGDLWLVDLSQYVCVDYGDINEASSIHFKFDYAQTTFRFVYYFDGQPRLVSAITPYKGSSNTISPFVNIATR